VCILLNRVIRARVCCYSVPDRRRGTGGTVPAEAVGRVQEAEEQMLFETREKGARCVRNTCFFTCVICCRVAVRPAGVLRAVRDVLRDRVVGRRHTRHQVSVHVPSDQISGAHGQRV